MKNFKIFIIFVLGMWLVVGDIDLVNAKSQIEVTEYRAPGGRDIIGFLSRIPIFKPFIPLIQNVPVLIGKILKTTVTDPLFPVLKQLADKVSGFSNPFFSKQPEQIQQRLAAMQIQPLFNLLVFVPPILFFAPIVEPIVNAIKPLIYEILRLVISFSVRFVFHLAKGK